MEENYGNPNSAGRGTRREVSQSHPSKCQPCGSRCSLPVPSPQRGTEIFPHCNSPLLKTLFSTSLLLGGTCCAEFCLMGAQKHHRKKFTNSTIHTNIVFYKEHVQLNAFSLKFPEPLPTLHSLENNLVVRKVLFEIPGCSWAPLRPCLDCPQQGAPWWAKARVGWRAAKFTPTSGSAAPWLSMQLGFAGTTTTAPSLPPLQQQQQQWLP